MEAVARQDTTEIRTNRQRESSAVLRGGGGSVRTRWDEGARMTRLGGEAYVAASDAIALSQLYRDRGDCENIFDELKNQWGWGGFVTHDLARAPRNCGAVRPGRHVGGDPPGRIPALSWWKAGATATAGPQPVDATAASGPLLTPPHRYPEPDPHGYAARIRLQLLFLG